MLVRRCAHGTTFADCVFIPTARRASHKQKATVNKLIYIIGLIVVVLALASWLGLR
jgi:hypothetical protein